MIFRLKKTFEVSQTQTNNNNFASVCCTIPKFCEIRKFVQIGESITTDEFFELNFDELKSKWMLIFYPKGQYDYGVASDDCRLYIKLISCDKPEVKMVKMKIDIFLTAMPSSGPSIGSYSSDATDATIFFTNDSKRSWAGPFRMRLNDRDCNPRESLMIKCTFKLLSRENKLITSGSQPMLFDTLKRTRPITPTDVDLLSSHSMDVDVLPIEPSTAMEVEDLPEETLNSSVAVNSSNVEATSSGPFKPTTPPRYSSRSLKSSTMPYASVAGKTSNVEALRNSSVAARSSNNKALLQPPNPFEEKSPLTYNKADLSNVNPQRGSFQSRAGKRAENAAEKYSKLSRDESLPTSRRDIHVHTPSQSSQKNQQTSLQSKQWTSSRCLQLSDFEGEKKDGTAEKENALEMSMFSVGEKVKLFEDKLK